MRAQYQGEIAAFDVLMHGWLEGNINIAVITQEKGKILA